MRTPRRILLVRNDGIGDLVCTLPALAAVRRHFLQAHVAALASPAAAPLLAGSRYVDESIVDDPTESPWQLARRLRPMRFDAAVVFNTNTRGALAVWLAGIRQRVCWAYKPAGLLFGNRRVALHRSHPPIHETDFTLAFAQRLGAVAEAADRQVRLDIDPVMRDRVAARIERQLGSAGPLFGVNPGNNRGGFNWPEAHYARLIGQLSRHGRVMVTGSGDQRPLLERIESQLGDAARERVGFFCDFQLQELAAAISLQTALTVASTGPMHVAGVVGTPAVALFSPHPAHSPKKWAPLGSGHTLLVAPLEPGEDPRVSREQAPSVMARIDVDQVLQANLKYVRQNLAAAGRTARAKAS